MSRATDAGGEDRLPGRHVEVPPDERHEAEQYFFDAATVTRCADLLTRFERPCCLCAPTVGAELVARGRAVTVLDIDERFAHLPDFRRFDLQRPQWQPDEFDVIFCDPPFFGVSLRTLRDALRLLSHHEPGSRALLVTWLARRGHALCDALRDFDIRPTGEPVGYRTVAPTAKNAIELFCNLPGETHD